MKREIAEFRVLHCQLAVTQAQFRWTLRCRNEIVSCEEPPFDKLNEEKNRPGFRPAFNIKETYYLTELVCTSAGLFKLPCSRA